MPLHARHLGRTTHVWDAEVTNAGTGRTMALFRCTQMILAPRLTRLPAVLVNNFTSER